MKECGEHPANEDELSLLVVVMEVVVGDPFRAVRVLPVKDDEKPAIVVLVIVDNVA